MIIAQQGGVVRRVGVAELPLHGGQCPGWLFPRMASLGAAIVEAIVLEFGQKELLNRLSDPFFFQSLGCVLGFDWHSSGLTTTTLGALKAGLSEKASELGIAICGGKGSASRKTPAEIFAAATLLNLPDSKADELVYASRMAAKVDSAAVQDGYQLYHHSFIMTERGDWCVVQQGMSAEARFARRYHWLSFGVKSFVEEPHSAIAAQRTEERVLNMVASESKDARAASLDALDDISHLKRLRMPKSHAFAISSRVLKALEHARDAQPKNYECLLAQPGIGPVAVRALALVSEIIYGCRPSWRDPAKFSFAHGGKDGIPFPVDRKAYDRSIEVLRAAVESAKVGEREKLRAMKNLSEIVAAANST